MDLIAAIVLPVLDLHRDMHRELAAALRAIGNGEGPVLSLAWVAFALGTVHALTPGHGKAILFTYFLGRKVHPWAGVAAAAQVAGMHVGAAIVLVLAFGGAAYVMGRPSGAALILQAVSSAAVSAAGFWYLWRAAHPGAIAVQAHHAGVAFSAGLLPCPLTMMILSIAFAHASLGLGLALVAVMAFGIMTTIAVTGTTAIAIQRGIAGGLDARSRRYALVLRWLEVMSAIVILGIGLSSALALLPNP
jgi:nickel/cobalt exporter